jgi:hypothetical protein
MRNNIEKYRRMKGVAEAAFQDREQHKEMHWVRGTSPNQSILTFPRHDSVIHGLKSDIAPSLQTEVSFSYPGI